MILYIISEVHGLPKVQPQAQTKNAALVWNLGEMQDYVLINLSPSILSPPTPQRLEQFSDAQKILSNEWIK